MLFVPATDAPRSSQAPEDAKGAFDQENIRPLEDNARPLASELGKVHHMDAPLADTVASSMPPSDECWMSRGLRRGRCSMVVPVGKTGSLLTGRNARGSKRGGQQTGSRTAGGLQQQQQQRAEELRVLMAEMALHFQEVSEQGGKLGAASDLQNEEWSLFMRGKLGRLCRVDSIKHEIQP